MHAQCLEEDGGKPKERRGFRLCHFDWLPVLIVKWPFIPGDVASIAVSVLCYYCYCKTDSLVAQVNTSICHTQLSLKSLNVAVLCEKGKLSSDDSKSMERCRVFCACRFYAWELYVFKLIEWENN